MTSTGDATLAAYNAAAETYIASSAPPSAAVVAYLDRIAELIGDGELLEIGSGPGWDAAYLESRGVRVIRSDATLAFVTKLRAEGHAVRELDVRSDQLGGPYAAVMANAVLLHLSRPEFSEALGRLRAAVGGSGVLGMTLKDGEGEAWSDAKLGVPRHFTYWRESEVRGALDVAGWEVVSIDQVEGRSEPWLFVIARSRAMTP